MNKDNKFKKKMLPAAISAITLSAMSAGVISADKVGRVEEVVVTAQYREQTVQDIPYNISAMSGDDIAAQQIIDQADLLRSISGVSVVDRGYRNSGTVNSIIIRGLNVDNGLVGDISLNAVPTVGTYVDNTPLFANFIIKDVNRVEVLRGPQGTLYGSGSLGGTVRYISNKPSMEGFSGHVTGVYGQTDGSNGNNLNVDALVNIPLGDKLAVRASIGRIDNDGVVDYVNAYQLNEFREPMINDNGTCVDPRDATDAQVLNNGACYTVEEDADTVEIDYGKIAVLFEVTDSLDLSLTYQAQEDEIGARRAITLGDNNQPVGSSNYFSYGDDDSGQVLLEPSSREVDLLSLDVEWDLGFATFTSTTSDYNHEGVGESDNGGFWVSGGEEDAAESRDWIDLFGYSGWPRPAQRAERGYSDDTLVQEFRLVSNETKANIDWLVGAFYFDQELTVFQNSWNPGMNEFNEACRATGDPVCDNFWPRFYSGLTERDFEYRRDVSFDEKALYGELTYHFSDSLRMTGGFRAFKTETINDTILGFPLVVGWTSPQVPRSTDDDSGTLLKLNMSWNASDSTMLYGTVSEGYRRGGANAIPSVDDGDPFGEANAEAIRTYEKDTVTNYEVGIKGDHENLRYTASLFYVDWKDPQLNATSDWYGFYMAVNGDKASTQGFELELEGYLTDNLHYHAGYAYVSAELDADFVSPQSGRVVAESGSKLPATPSNVLSLSLDNTWSINDAVNLVGRISSYYQSESENFIDADALANQTHDAFSLWSASLTLISEEWSATLYGKNLGNEAGVTGAFPSSYWSYDTGAFENWYGNGNRQFITQPRTIGVSFGYSF